MGFLKNELLRNFCCEILRTASYLNGSSLDPLCLDHISAKKVLQPTENGGYKIDVYSRESQGKLHASVTLDPNTGLKSIGFEVQNPKLEGIYEVPDTITVEDLKKLHADIMESSYENDDELYRFLAFIDNIIYFAGTPVNDSNKTNEFAENSPGFKSTERYLKNLLEVPYTINSVTRSDSSTTAKITAGGLNLTITLEGARYYFQDRIIKVVRDDDTQDVSKIKISCISTPKVLSDYFFSTWGNSSNNLNHGRIDTQKLKDLIERIDSFK